MRRLAFLALGIAIFVGSTYSAYADNFPAIGQAASALVLSQAPGGQEASKNITFYAKSGPEFTTRFAALPFPQVFTTGSLEYTGLTKYYQGKSIVSEATTAIIQLKASNDIAARKDIVSRFIAEHPDEPINAAVLFYHLVSYLPLETAPVTLAAFEERVPPWTELGNAVCKGTAAYLYLDQAWQAQAEGDNELALEFFARCKDLSLSIILEYPDDPETTLAIENYSRSAKAQGDEASAECVERLREVVDKNPKTLVTWFCRDHIAFISVTNKLLKSEHTEQFAKMLDELRNGGFVEEALASPKVSRHTKSDVMLMTGHTLLGNGLLDEAEEAYKKGLESCSNQYEWNPRDRGRAIVYDVHYGLRDMTAFSLTLVRHWKYHESEPETAIAAWKEMAEAFPKGENTDYALLDEAKLEAQVGRYEDAKKTLHTIVGDYPRSDVVALANAELTRVATLSSK